MNYVINCRGKLLDLTNPKVMGIVNLSANSFYADSYKNTLDSIMTQVESHINSGATIIDLGAQSTKPGAKEIDIQDEIGLLRPVLEEIDRRNYDCFISIDTYRAPVASAALEYSSVHMINDIGGGDFDTDMLRTVGRFGDVPYILMHNRKKSEYMENYTTYDDLILEMYTFFMAQKAKADQAGIRDVILDVGIGFSKTLDQNFEILQQLKNFKGMNCPLLMGLSRKSFIYKTLGIEAEDCLSETSAMHMIALQGGSNILRVHDVKEAVRCIELHHKLLQFA